MGISAENKVLRSLQHTIHPLAYMNVNDPFITPLLNSCMELDVSIVMVSYISCVYT